MTNIEVHFCALQITVYTLCLAMLWLIYYRSANARYLRPNTSLPPQTTHPKAFNCRAFQLQVVSVDVVDDVIDDDVRGRDHI